MQNFIIITPAHNEEAFIERTIVSMTNQTIQPLMWIVVNDGSTDRTDEIVMRYQLRHSFIKLVNVARPNGRHFGNKARAFNCGLAEIGGRDYKFIGNLDADISLDPKYFENILREFDKDIQLGIAGGIVFTKIGDEFFTHDKTLDSVGGAVQLFRRECFEQVGGYPILPHGGMDTVAEITARMNGWKVRKFPENRVFESRRTGTASVGPLVSRIKEGRQFYSLGYGIMFFLLRCVFRLKDRPIILGSTAALAGFLFSMIRHRPIVLSDKAVRYLRAEQWGKIKRLIRFQLG